MLARAKGYACRQGLKSSVAKLQQKNEQVSTRAVRQLENVAHMKNNNKHISVKLSAIA